MEYSDSVHNFLKKIKKMHIDNKYKEILIEIVNSLEKRTKKQKNRFISYYCSKDEFKQETLKSIAERENCRPGAIRYSIVRITASLVHLKDERKNALIEIMQNCIDKKWKM